MNVWFVPDATPADLAAIGVVPAPAAQGRQLVAEVAMTSSAPPEVADCVFGVQTGGGIVLVGDDNLGTADPGVFATALELRTIVGHFGGTAGTWTWVVEDVDTGTDLVEERPDGPLDEEGLLDLFEEVSGVRLDSPSFLGSSLVPLTWPDSLREPDTGG